LSIKIDAASLSAEPCTLRSQYYCLHCTLVEIFPCEFFVQCRNLGKATSTGPDPTAMLLEGPVSVEGPGTPLYTTCELYGVKEGHMTLEF